MPIKIIDKSWNLALNAEFDKSYYIDLIQTVALRYKIEDIWPKKENLFNAFEKCPFDQVKVVILGQDPYPTPGHAQGLAFSIPETVRPLAKSLKNIFKELETDLKLAPKDNGDLSAWAEQGVLLLNTVLTVKAGEANSHKSLGWQKFTDAVIRAVSEQKENVIFMLWGNPAQEKEKLIDTTKHGVLKAAHPSPLSAYRGFFGCKHFSKANEMLILHEQQPINW